MGIHKFRSIEDMNAAPPIVTGAAHGFERFVRHCARYWRLAPRMYPRGVVKFRTIHDAQEARVRVSMISPPVRRAPVDSSHS